ncbi:MAG: methyl-accepting chemotaxis protein [Chitinivorax sp.]
MSLSRLVGRLSFPAKFFLIGLLFLIPVSILLLMVARNSLQDINTIRNEQAGLRINNQVRALLQHVQRHRGLSSLWLSGHQADEARLLATEGELDQLLRSIPPDLPEQLQRWGVADEWNKFTGEWTQIRGSWRSSDAAGNLNSHILLVQRLLQISRQIQDRSELALDPENESFHIQNLLFERLLQVTEQVGVARSTGVGVATRAQITQPERVKLAIAGGLIHQLVQSMRADLQGAYDHSPAFKAELGATNEALLARMDDAQQLILHDFVEQETVNVQPEQFFTDMSQIIDTSYQLYDQLAERLRRLLQQRYDNHVRYEASIGIVVVVTGLLALLMFMTIYRTLRASVHDLRNVSGLLATGDLTVRARIVGDDELTQIARAFNDMAQHLRTLIGEISGAVTQVQTSTVTMANSSANIARSSQEQSVSAASMAAAVEQMTVSVSLVADNTRETDKTASSSQNLAAEAQQIVLAAVHEMQQVADAVTQTAGTINTLNASSAEISQIVGVIKEIADQTNLLALNAAIEAARAGEVGRGFAVVADEVRKLAERTSEATTQIATTINVIQRDTVNAASSMNQGNDKVVAGVEMIQEAGNAMMRIQSGTNDVKHAISDIAVAATEQRNASHEIARNVENIAQMAETNAAAVQNAAKVAAQLEDAAEHLRQTLARFRL